MYCGEILKRRYVLCFLGDKIYLQGVIYKFSKSFFVYQIGYDR